MLKKIVVIGPECTGKSTLCQQLAEHYQTAWCPEYAREYLLKHGKKYTYNDLLTIAKGQIELEKKITQSAINNKQLANFDSSFTIHHSPIFIDTDMYVMKVWCEYVFGKSHPFIIDQIAKRKYDLYLLCSVDLPWIKDELREYPDLESRQELFDIYKNLMENQSTPWTIISGNSNERFQNAITAVNDLLKK